VNETFDFPTMDFVYLFVSKETKLYSEKALHMTDQRAYTYV